VGPPGCMTLKLRKKTPPCEPWKSGVKKSGRWGEHQFPYLMPALRFRFGLGRAGRTAAAIDNRGRHAVDPPPTVTTSGSHLMMEAPKLRSQLARSHHPRKPAPTDCTGPPFPQSAPTPSAGPIHGLGGCALPGPRSASVRQPLLPVQTDLIVEFTAAVVGLLSSPVRVCRDRTPPHPGIKCRAPPR